MNLESPKINLSKSSEEVFSYLSDVRNFEHLMPENIDKFEAQEDSFLFALKGMPEIRLKMQETESPKKVVLGSASEKFPFTLTAEIEGSSPDNCSAQLHFEGEFNPMVAMMVKNPLQKFINTLSENIQKNN